MTGAGVDQVRELMASRKTYLLLGSSGVGKTTLINRLLGVGALETREVSHTGEGRHTTTRRQLIVLEGGGMLIDMPGMRELGMLGAGEGIDETFADIEALARSCRYPDCSHGSEPDCAVRAAIERRALAEDHLRNYLKLRKESEFHELSHAGRRRGQGFRAVGAHTTRRGRAAWNESRRRVPGGGRRPRGGLSRPGHPGSRA